jgi:hypothetical protein
VDEIRQQLIRSVKVAAGMGVVMGFAYFLVLWRFEEPIRSSKAQGLVFDVIRGPALLFLVLSLAFGWCVTWLSARIAGMSGPVLWVPVGCATLAALVVGLGLSLASITPLPPIIWLVFGLWGVAALGAAAFRMRLDE